jgi:hypothetical protein
MNDKDLLAQQTKGQISQSLLENELLAEALDAIEAEVIQQWEACPARDVEGKETLWKLYKVSKKFRAVLNGYVETGKLASEQLRHLDEKRSRLRSLFKVA